MRLRLVCSRIALLGVVLLVTVAPASAATISLNALLTNPSFETDAAGSACPTGWICTSGSVGTYVPNGTDYSSAPFAPDGTNVAYFPSTANTSTSLQQTITGQSYVVGNTYELTFWMGVPLGALMPATVRPAFVVKQSGNIVTDNLCGQGSASLIQVSPAQGPYVSGAPACQWDLNFAPLIPTAGTWRQFVMSYTPTSNITGDLGIQFFLTKSVNGQEVNLDLAGPSAAPVPEPASLLLLGTGLVAIVARRRFKSRP